MTAVELDNNRAQVDAIRTVLIFLASAVADKFQPNERESKLAQFANATDMRGTERVYAETSKLLISLLI